MPRFIIEREIPEIGTADREALRDASQKSNGVLTSMRENARNILWEHSYVTDNKIFCVYQADSEELIHEHARESGFPATTVTRVRKVIDPVTAEDD